MTPNPRVSTQLMRKSYPLSVTANIEADRLATETAKIARDRGCRQDMPPVMMPPYPGSRALLKIGTTWITGKLGTHINNAHWTQTLRDYCKRKYTWSDTVFDSIDWKLIDTARKKYTLTQLMQTSKIMHDSLPVMHMGMDTSLAYNNAPLVHIQMRLWIISFTAHTRR